MNCIFKIINFENLNFQQLAFYSQRKKTKKIHHPLQ